MIDELDAIEFADNPDPRCPCILLLDVSYSMTGNPIDELNAGLKIFQDELQKDKLGRRRVDICVITFGGDVQVAQPFVTADAFEAPTLTTDGNTPMGEALNTALDMLEERKASYRSSGLPHYRPWVFVITDGAPTDGVTFDRAVDRVCAAQRDKKLTCFPVGVVDADVETLARLSPSIRPLKLKGLKFSEFFLWLSASLSAKTASTPGEKLPLPATDGWGETVS